MNLVSGYPFWLIKEGLPFNYPALQKSISTDVLIIGGGISGALAGYHLVNAGVKCVIVDSRSIGLGSTCASTSLLQYEIDTPLSKLIDKVGLNTAVLSYKLCEEAISKIGLIDKKIKCGEFEFKKRFLIHLVRLLKICEKFVYHPIGQYAELCLCHMEITKKLARVTDVQLCA